LTGTLQVHRLGDWLFPQSIAGRFTIISAILRQLHLTFCFLLASLFHHLSDLPLFSSYIHPLSRPFTSSADWSSRRQLLPFDVLIVDQLSASVPLLRWFGQNRVVFYCHFPDLLLSPSRPASHALNDPRAPRPWSLKGQVRSLYRRPIDALEETTTGEADKILVNSDFTSQVFQRTFAGLMRLPRVVYPSVDVHAYGKEVKPAKDDEWLIRCVFELLTEKR
jgi:alpha-1,3/alpha-1,6-mannosyltransferase